MTFLTRTATAPTRAPMSPPRAVLFGALAVAATMILPWDSASAAIVPKVPLGTSADYSVLGATPDVTNTGGSILNRNLGIYPASATPGFENAVIAGATHAGDAEALQAQSDLTTAYLNAQARPIDGTTTQELAGVTLTPGVWVGGGDGSLLLSASEPLILDGEGNLDAVFIIKTTSSLTVMPNSSVVYQNGAQACNVFWQVGSSADLGTGADFVGTILALTSITMSDSVTVDGRALARNGTVTLINDTFISSPCDLQSSVTPDTTTPADVTTTTTADAGTATTVDATAVTVAGTTDITTNNTTGTTRFGDRPGNDLTLRLPETGRPVGAPIAMAAAFLALGAVATWFGRRKLVPQG